MGASPNLFVWTRRRQRQPRSGIGTDTLDFTVTPSRKASNRANGPGRSSFQRLLRPPWLSTMSSDRAQRRRAEPSSYHLPVDSSSWCSICLRAAWVVGDGAPPPGLSTPEGQHHPHPDERWRRRSIACLAAQIREPARDTDSFQISAGGNARSVPRSCLLPSRSSRYMAAPATMFLSAAPETTSWRVERATTP